MALGLGLGPISSASAVEVKSPRERLLLDFGWRFHLGNEWGTGEDLVKAGSSSGPARPGFSDADWRPLNLPHDWVIELPFDEKADGSHGFKPVGPGFPQNSVGWYRRAFELPKEDAGKRLWLEFDGAYRDCRVYVNGYTVGHHESGYGSFRYDITDVAKCGGKNVVAVRVDASQFEGWFYEGAGLYRHVWLVKTALLNVVPDGTFVFSAFENNLPQGPAEIIVKTRLANSQTNTASVKVICRVSGRTAYPLGRMNRRRSWNPPPKMKPFSQSALTHPSSGRPKPQGSTRWSLPSSPTEKSSTKPRPSSASARWPLTQRKAFC